MSSDDEMLTGNVTTGVVRVGDTVRRPVGAWTDSVDALLEHLHAVGFTAAPRPLGRDELGRQVLEYVHGELGAESGTYSAAELFSIGRMLADLHEALTGFVPPAGAAWNRIIPPDREALICHNDVAPWNLVRSDRGWVLIDWDAAAPGSRLWDLAYAAQSMAGLHAGRPVSQSAARLRAFTDGYGLVGAGQHGHNGGAVPLDQVREPGSQHGAGFVVHTGVDNCGVRQPLRQHRHVVAADLCPREVFPPAG